MELDEKRLDRAVQLASSFIANGDIRMAGNTRETSNGMTILGDLLVSLYNVLESVETQVTRPE